MTKNLFRNKRKLAIWALILFSLVLFCTFGYIGYSHQKKLNDHIKEPEQYPTSSTLKAGDANPSNPSTAQTSTNRQPTTTSNGQNKTTTQSTTTKPVDYTPPESCKPVLSEIPYKTYFVRGSSGTTGGINGQLSECKYSDGRVASSYSTPPHDKFVYINVYTSDQPTAYNLCKTYGSTELVNACVALVMTPN